MTFEVKELGFRFPSGYRVFDDVNFTLEKGETLSILGANGAGKSTLLNCIAGLYRPSKGSILIDGKDISLFSRRKIASYIGYVPQIHDPGFAYTVLEFTVMGRTPYIGVFSKPSKEDYRSAERALERMGALDLRNKVFTEMSGGEQQMVMIARVLTQDPEMILLDEPTNHLDFGNQYRTIDMIAMLRDEGFTVITTTHNPDHALKLGGKTAILNKNGSLIAGRSDEQLTSKALSELYNINIGIDYNEDAKRNICYVRK